MDIRVAVEDRDATLPLLVVQGGDEHLSNIQVSGRETVIRMELPGAAEPSQVVLDPDSWILKGSR